MNGISLGLNTIGKTITFQPPPGAAHHHHVIGASGTGKSKFLEYIIRGNLQSRQGFCLIDPHGTLYEAVLRHAAYNVLSHDIVLLNLSDPSFVVPCNFFQKDPATETSVQVDNLIQATLHAWDARNADSTPTLERVLRLIFTTLLDAELSLPEIAYLLEYSQKDLRTRVIAKIRNELIRGEWEELSSLSKAKEFRDEILSAKNRLFRLLTSNTLTKFMGVKGRAIDLFDAMEKQQTILINLAPSSNLSAENARLFGSLLVHQFFLAAVKRAKRDDGKDPTPYYLYLDEFQNFVSIDLCNALDQLRKFGLFLILSHQRFGQLDDAIEDAVLTNCRIKTVFGGLRVEDARRMAEELFIGSLDPLRVKVAIYQTKFWPVYSRDKVFSKTSSQSESFGTSSGSAEALLTGDHSASVETQSMLPSDDGFFTGGMWFDPTITSISKSSTSGFTSSRSAGTFSSESSSTTYGEAESIADIPIFIPVPFKELSSVQYYSVDEQLLELTQALKLSEQRRGFIQLPGQQTQPLLVPFIHDEYLSEQNYQWYVGKLMAQANALTPSEADRLISQARKDLLSLRDTPPEQASSQRTKTPPSTTKKQKRNIFDHIKEQNPDIDI